MTATLDPPRNEAEPEHSGADARPVGMILTG